MEHVVKNRRTSYTNMTDIQGYLPKIWFLVIFMLHVVSGSECNRNGTRTFKMCDNATFRGNRAIFDTDIFLDTTHPFCVCELQVLTSITISRLGEYRPICGPLMSVKLSPYSTVKQFTCRYGDHWNITRLGFITVFLELRGIGQVDMCFEASSDFDFNVICHTKGVTPPGLTTPPSSSVTTSTITTSTVPITQSLTSTQSPADNATDIEKTSPVLLAASGIDDTFVLILSSCIVGVLALLAVALLLTCKCVRHMRRKRENENTSYDITAESPVQKISARKLDDGDSESGMIDNPVYEEAWDVKMKNRRITSFQSEIALALSEVTKNSNGHVNIDVEQPDTKPIVKPTDTDLYAVVKRKT